MEISKINRNLDEKDTAIRTLESKISQMGALQDNLEEDKENMIKSLKDILKVFDIESDHMDWKELLEKINEKLTNYEEDKRSLKNMIDEKE